MRRIDNDVDRARRVLREADDIFGFITTLANDDELPSPELQDKLDALLDRMIEFRCALESATYEGLDHFEREVTA
jgi:hypothetical protein